jgi:hypothetical protein
MKNKKVTLDEIDLQRIYSILECIDDAGKEAEKTSKRVLGESNPAYEFGFLKSYVEQLGMGIKTILEDKKYCT